MQELVFTCKVCSKVEANSKNVCGRIETLNVSKKLHFAAKVVSMEVGSTCTFLKGAKFISLLCVFFRLQEADDSGNPKKIEDLCVFRHDVLFVAKEPGLKFVCCSCSTHF